MTQHMTLNNGVEMPIIGFDTGASAFFDHRDPAMVHRLNETRS